MSISDWLLAIFAVAFSISIATCNPDMLDTTPAIDKAFKAATIVMVVSLFAACVWIML